MNAETTWTSAKKKAVVASQDFTATVLLKPARSKAVPAGWCTRPYVPSATATAAASSAGTRKRAAPGRRCAGCGEGKSCVAAFGSMVMDASRWKRGSGGGGGG